MRFLIIGAGSLGGYYGGMGAAIAVCFSPEEDCAAFAVRAIDNAEHDLGPRLWPDDWVRHRRGAGPGEAARCRRSADRG